jgi:hypothetical protein
MGYSTYFSGSVSIEPPLEPEHLHFLQKFNETRRMARKVDPKHGVEGEWYVDGGDGVHGHGQEKEENIIDYNHPPSTQPGLWCQWRPSDDGACLEHDGGEKFYDYVEWMRYLVDNYLTPRGYLVNGQIEWDGEDSGDMGIIIVEENVVTVKHAKITYE